MTIARITRDIRVVSGAYTHQLVDRYTAPPVPDGFTATVCGITVDPFLANPGTVASVDCPYCTGRRSKWESKASR